MNLSNAGAGVGGEPLPLDRVQRLRAEGHRLVAEGHAKLAEAEALACDAQTIAAADEWIPLVRARDAFGVTSRRLLDAAKRGELVINRAGKRATIVRRSEVERWIASRRVAIATSPTTPEQTAEDFYATLTGKAKR